MKKIAALLYLLLYLPLAANAQTGAVKDSISPDTVKNIKFNYKQLIIPSILIGYGALGLGSDQLKTWNLQVRAEVKEDIDKKTSIDDFSQWAPAASVFALDAFGVKGKNNLKDQATIILTSYVIMSATVLPLKSITKEERPDGSSYNSFPSGHTATAFAGAEFLFQEYKDKSIWIGIAGYAVATGTGLFRVYNNRHWITDITAGAGIGILSTKMAYWINPFIKKTLYGNKERKATSFVLPFYDGRNIGLSYIKTF